MDGTSAPRPVSANAVKSWLATALEAWFGEDTGRWAFQPYALSIGNEPDLARDLVAIYSDLPAVERTGWRQAVRDLLAERGKDVSFRHAVEVLLDMATLMRASEVLDVLADLITEDDGPARERMANRVIAAAVSLSSPTRSAADCLERIRTSPLFAAHHAGLVLTALCRVEPDRWTDHMVALEPAMQDLEESYPSDGEALRLYAKSVLRSITLSRVTEDALDTLWSGLASVSGSRWNWFCEELFVGEDPLADFEPPWLTLRDNPSVRVRLDRNPPLSCRHDPPVRISVPESQSVSTAGLVDFLEEHEWLMTGT